MVFFVKYFKQYLLGRKFVLRTDHAALQWLRRTPDPMRQQARWLEQLAAFDFYVVHRPGIRHGNADGVSRIPCRQCGRDEGIEVEKVAPIVGEETDVWSSEALKREQAKDAEIAEFIDLLHAVPRSQADVVRTGRTNRIDERYYGPYGLKCD